MKRILAAMLAAVISVPMLFTACSKEDPRETSQAAEVLESGILTGVYSADVYLDINPTCTPFLPVETDQGSGYRFASTDLNDDSLTFHTVIGGADLEITVDKGENPTRTACFAISEEGVYAIEYDRRNRGIPTRLYHYDFDGNVVKAVGVDDMKPLDKSDFADFPGEANMYNSHQLPILKTDDGYLLGWGNYILTLDKDFRNPEKTEYLYDIICLMRDEVTGTAYAYCQDDVPILIDIATGTEIRMDDVPYDRWSRSGEVVGIHGGIVYRKIKEGIESVHLPEKTTEQILNFANSSLAEIPMRIYPDFSGEAPAFTLVFNTGGDPYGKSPVGHYVKGDDIDISSITMLELVTAGRNNTLQSLVMQFNASQKDCRIIINDYSRFNTEEDNNAGLSRFRLDLETGIVKPDLILLDSRTYYDLVTGSEGIFTDLNTLDFSDSKYSPDDLWPAIRHAGEVDGKYYGFLPSFRMTVMVGLKEYIGDIESWDLEGFLDFAKSLGEGEYLLDSYGKNNYSTPFHVGFNMDPFFKKGTFDDPLYRRYLNFISSLPEKGPAIQQKSTSNKWELEMSGDYHDADIVYTEAGENMYQNGTIKLYKCELSTPNRIMSLLDALGAESPAELNFIGYPSGRGRGCVIQEDFDSIVAVTKYCEKPEFAWDLMEFMIDDGVKTAEESYGVTKLESSAYQTAIPVVKEAGEKYLRSLEGLQFYLDYMNGGWYTGQENVEKMMTRVPGRRFIIDETWTAVYLDLLNSELLTLADTVPLSLMNIVRTEENLMLKGEQDLDTTMQAVISRTAIWLSEHE